MSVIAPWLRPTDVLGAIEGGARAGLAARSEANRSSESDANRAASQQDAAARLKLSYDSLAQQADEAKRRDAAQQASNQAAMALRQQQADALAQYRSQQQQFEQAKVTAAQKLQQDQQADTVGFLKAAKEQGAEAAYEAFPKAHPALVHQILAQDLLKQNTGDKTATSQLNSVLKTADPVDAASVLQINDPAMRLQAAGLAAERAGVEKQNTAKQSSIEALNQGLAPTMKIGPDGKTTTTYAAPKVSKEDLNAEPKSKDLGAGRTAIWMPGGKGIHIVEDGKTKEPTPGQLMTIAKGLQDDDPDKKLFTDQAKDRMKALTGGVKTPEKKRLVYDPATGQLTPK